MNNHYTVRGKLILFYWLPAILWAAIILSAYSEVFSAQHSGSVFADLIIRFIGHPLPPRQFNLIHILLRKCAHLASYFILGALWFRAIRGERSGWRAGW